MEFNKQVVGMQAKTTPSITFRLLEKTGANDRYQGEFNRAGKRLINSTIEKKGGLQILFSDQHSTIGFNRSVKEGTKLVFGATELFNSLNLVIGKRYKLTVTDTSDHGTLLTIDADEHLRACDG